MAVTFKAKVVGDIPANRLCVLGGREEEDIILIKVADNSTAADFVSTKNLADGDITDVTLKDGVNIWEVEAYSDIETGQWVVCREDGTVGNRSGTFGEHIEEVGFTVESATAGDLVKVVRRESLANGFALELVNKVTSLESRVSALESGE